MASEQPAEQTLTERVLEALEREPELKRAPRCPDCGTRRMLWVGDGLMCPACGWREPRRETT